VPPRDAARSVWCPRNLCPRNSEPIAVWVDTSNGVPISSEGAEPLPPASKTAERIKSVKSTRSIEPAPERSSARAATTAEVLVTARIWQAIEFPTVRLDAAEPETPPLAGAADEPAIFAPPGPVVLDSAEPRPGAGANVSHREREVASQRKKAL
jgi:hypothetical protein